MLHSGKHDWTKCSFDTEVNTVEGTAGYRYSVTGLCTCGHLFSIYFEVRGVHTIFCFLLTHKTLPLSRSHEIHFVHRSSQQTNPLNLCGKGHTTSHHGGAASVEGFGLPVYNPLLPPTYIHLPPGPDREGTGTGSDSYERQQC